MARNKLRKEIAEAITSMADVDNPYKKGTNAFFLSIGWGRRQVDETVDNYGSELVQHASRIAYDLMKKGFPSRVAGDVLDPIAKFGPETVRRLAFDYREDPRNMSRNYQVLDARVVAPNGQSGGLENVANQQPLLLRPVHPNGKPNRERQVSTILYVEK